ncbi:MAG: RNA-binding S4 domain-containing protein [Bacilli bacterium]|jgi:ribosomal 50S subunit-recycling heat shock protein|nr:RNA-binding S4 domain-containing protein [Acholeplasmataceae bacterium]
MRLDKFLKVSRLIKRRSLAKEFTDADRVLVNNKVAKPSKELAVGDIITIRYGKKIIEVKVKELLNSTKKEDSFLMYELISETDNYQEGE